MAYATLTELKAELNIAVDTWDTVLQNALDWAQGWIDDEAHRSFEAGTVSREYDASALDPRDRSILWVDDDLLTVGTLTNGDDDATVLGSATYWLWPRNETPHYGIKLKSGYVWVFDTDGVVTVNGTWGYSATADATIKGYALRLAEWRYRSKDLIETITPFSDTLSTKMPPGFPAEITEGLAKRARLAR